MNSQTQQLTNTLNKKSKRKGKRPMENVDPGYLFNIGENLASQNYLGVHSWDGGWIFRVWAPRAANVEVTGDFNGWGSAPMERLETGIWQVHIHENIAGSRYKFRITGQDGQVKLKADPFATESEVRPNNASIVRELQNIQWTDTGWLRSRRLKNHFNKPMSIYELHVGSWMKHPDGRFYSYLELKDRLIPYVKEMGYTHIELMPLMEHPNDASWGYQVTGYFAVTTRYGSAEMLKEFINACHEQGIGVIMDWVPAHFVTDEHGLAYFDGTATFEHEDYNKAFNQGWGTLHFDFSKPEVQSFLISNALFYLSEFHIDGLRMDAVSSMLYLDYDGKSFIPNSLGGNTDLEAIEFIKKLNQTIHQAHPGTLVIAEESTSYEKMTAPLEEGGLGFDFKWNMGWMNDILRYIEMEPAHRVFNQRLLNFSFMYTFKEKYILPFSHDEVVHGKRSMVDKAPGDLYNKFATFRLIMTYMMMHPGKKLNFMTNDIAQMMEWRDYQELEWVGLSNHRHRGAQHLMRKLNALYTTETSLYELESTPQTIQILDVENPDALVKFLRQGKRKKDFLLCLFNFDQKEVQEVRFGVPYEGVYEEILNTELEEFGGVWTKGHGLLESEAIPMDGLDHSIVLTAPSLGAVLLKPVWLRGDKKSNRPILEQ